MPPEPSGPKPLRAIEKLAEKVCEEIAPLCERVEIAGSIRRRRPVCGDIDIVVLPKGPLDMEWSRMMWRLAGADGALVVNGSVSKRVILRISKVQCDLWFADRGTVGDLFEENLPANFGAMLLTYTGTPAHNMRVVSAAKARGWKWSPTRGLAIPRDDGRVEMIAGDERAILERLGMGWVRPEDRE